MRRLKIMQTVADMRDRQARYETECRRRGLAVELGAEFVERQIDMLDSEFDFLKLKPRTGASDREA